ncbi:MAG: PIN domain nuclease [Acidimicrobiia bacterium]|nr:PIN domain nuclease [Acidimicrobiia bacterium]
MLIADTSAWIEFLRATGSFPAGRLRQAISTKEVIVIDAILLEVMAGARRDAVARTQRLLEAQHMEALSSKLDWLDAATIYRELRWRGVTVRSQIDALIAAVAIRLDVPVLHHDRDFGYIARHTPLRTVET